MPRSVVYLGPSSAVDIIIPGGSIRAERDIPVEVPDALAESLLEQDIFEAAKAAPKKER